MQNKKQGPCTTHARTPEEKVNGKDVGREWGGTLRYSKKNALISYPTSCMLLGGPS